MVNNFNDRPYYYRNRFPKQKYIGVKLIGTRTSRDAVGAVVQVAVGHIVLVKQVESVGGYLSQSSSVLIFPLAALGAVEAIHVRWPEGRSQTVPNPKLNRVIEIREEK